MTMATTGRQIETTMKAVTLRAYGGPEVLDYSEVARPVPGAAQVLVRVRASSVNAYEYRTMRADPFLVRLKAGLFKPKSGLILGGDVAGVVEAVGSDVRGLNVGDEVFGDAFQDELGAFAEYVCVRASSLVSKPEQLSFEEAAALPLAAITALQALRDKAAVQPGQRVLIQGAGGGVGTFAVQIAKSFGAHVTAVCGSGSAELVTVLGADRVIDYTREDFAEQDDRYDVILGINGHHSLGDYRRCLEPGGRYVMVGGDNRQIFEALLFGKLRFLGSAKAASIVTIVGSKRARDLAQLRDLLASGQLESVVDRVYGLEETAEAFRYVERHHVKGKVVIRVAAR